PPKANDLPFPPNVRALQAGWKLLFFKEGRFVADAKHDAQWNRGAYLADALGHCGACHTPRNALGAEVAGKSYAGAVIDGWIAPALTPANPSGLPWSSAEIASYMTTGISLHHGTAVGPMSAVVHDGVAKLAPADQAALARYIESLGHGDARAAEVSPALARAAAVRPAADADGRLFTAACGSCHYGAGAPNAQSFNALRPEIALNSAALLVEPTNLIRVILYGIGAKQGAPGVVMPGFAGFSDHDIARLAATIRATQTGKPAWDDLEQKVADIRAAGHGES
ncbi:MAG: c-type cytochrome, partial [Sandarakinorhabdus sp.]|nr:c-type cytochrome [Sandarakinorhabdus sp.]